MSNAHDRGADQLNNMRGVGVGHSQNDNASTTAGVRNSAREVSNGGGAVGIADGDEVRPLHPCPCICSHTLTLLEQMEKIN